MTRATRELSIIKPILKNKNLTIYQKMTLIVIRTHEIEHGRAFPNYDTIADQGSMCKRKAQDTVKELTGDGYLKKEHRFAVNDGKVIQLSNEYRSVVENEPHAPTPSQTHEPHAPYSFKDFNSLKDLEEDINIKGNRYLQEYLIQFKNYREIVVDMARTQYEGVLPYDRPDIPFGLISFHGEEFLQCCKDYKLPYSVASLIYTAMRKNIGQYHFDAIRATFAEFVPRLRKGRIKTPVTWLESTFYNFDLTIRARNAMAGVG